MGILSRLERRAAVVGAGHPRDPVIAEWFAQANSASGQRVTPDTAMGVMAVYRAVRLISQTMASLPLRVYERMEPTGKRIAENHPLAPLFRNRPNDWQTPFEWKEMMAGHLELRGNAYSEVKTDGRGRVKQLIPLHPDRVVVKRGRVKDDSPLVVWYEVRPLDGPSYVLFADEMLHLRGFSTDGLTGLCPITIARETIGLAMAAQEHGARFFSNNASPGGVLSHPQKLGKEARKALKESWEEMQSGARNAHRIAVLEEGLTWTAVGLTNKDAEFIDSRKFQVTEIARMFDLPPHKLMDLERGTFTNIEHQSIEWLQDCIRPRAVRWEEAAARDCLLPSDEDRYFLRFNLEGLLRGDSAARGEFYTKLFTIGALSVNDIREKEDMNPVDGGEERFVPLNMVPLSRASDALDLPSAPDAPSTDPAATRAAVLQERLCGAHARLFVDAIERTLRKELTAARRALDKAIGARSLEPFTAWIADFYGEHEAFASRALAPAVHATGDALLEVVSLRGTVDPVAVRASGQLTAAMAAAAATAARAHVVASKGELRRLLRETPEEQRAVALSTLLTEWETNRAPADARAALATVSDAVTALAASWRALPPAA